MVRFVRYLFDYGTIREVLGYAIGHVGLFFSIIFFAWSAGDWLARYATLTNYNGLFDGAGYTSVHVLIPLYARKAGLAALLGLLVLGVSVARLAGAALPGRASLGSGCGRPWEKETGRRSGNISANWVPISSS